MSEEHFIDICRWVEALEWRLLKNLYGSAHSSIIGFLANGWLKSNEENSAVDAPPGIYLGEDAKRRRHADLFLCRREEVFAVVEVETWFSGYAGKIDGLKAYKEDPRYSGPKVGIFLTTNIATGVGDTYDHHFEEISNKISEINIPAIFISVSKVKLIGKVYPFRDNQYAKWNFTEIRGWGFFPGEHSHQLELKYPLASP